MDLVTEADIKDTKKNPWSLRTVQSSELSHMPPWCESILGMKVEAVQGNQVPLEWTETFGGFWNGGMTP